MSEHTLVRIALVVAVVSVLLHVYSWVHETVEDKGPHRAKKHAMLCVLATQESAGPAKSTGNDDEQAEFMRKIDRVLDALESNYNTTSSYVEKDFSNLALGGTSPSRYDLTSALRARGVPVSMLNQYSMFGM
jgi:hypothetical protein